jgi:hypothetical protein
MLLEGGVGLALVAAWFLPAHMLERRAPQPAPAKPQAGVSNEPIEPR